MKKIIDYDIIPASTSHRLIIAVRDKIADGWQPEGGLVLDMSLSPNEPVYHQTMVRYDETH